MSRRVKSRGRAVWSAVGVAIAVAVLSVLTPACAPPPEPTPFSPLDVPRDIDQMTDQQLDDSLTYVADDVRAGLTDPSFIEDIPADLRSTVADYAARIGTVDGRRQIATEFRELSKTAPHGMVDGLETVDTSQLQVDGGVKIDNIGRIARAGADTFVAGSAIFTSADYQQTIQAMRREIAGATII